MDTASILKDYYAHHNPQLATDAEVARICKALRLRAEQREGAADDLAQARERRRGRQAGRVHFFLAPRAAAAANATVI